jgi:hypothetical protein
MQIKITTLILLCGIYYNSNFTTLTLFLSFIVQVLCVTFISIHSAAVSWNMDAIYPVL